MDSFFNMDNTFWQAVGRVGDWILLSFLTVICSIPVITAGASLCALYYVSFKHLEDGNGSTLQNFFHSFRQNLVQGIALSVIVGGLFFLLSFDVRFMWRMGDFGGNRGLLYGGWILCILLGFLFLTLFLYVFPLQARFYNPLSVTLKNALAGGIGCFPKTVQMVLGDVCAAVLVVLCFQNIPQLAVIPLLAVLPVCASYHSWVLRDVLLLEPGKGSRSVPEEENGKHNV